MPPLSEPLPDLPHTWRPLGPRVVGVVLGVGLLVIMSMLWLGFDDETRSKVTPFQRGTVIFFVLLGASLMYALVRSRVVARRDKIVVVNGYKRREYDWAQVVGVNLPPGAPWATIDLADGSTVPAMGIQGSDGRRARRAVIALREFSAGLS